MAIKTNQLDIEICASKIAEMYDVFKIETSDMYINRGAYLLDAPLLCNNVSSVFFESGRIFYVLMRKDTSNKTNLRNVLLSSPDGDKITLTEMAIVSLDLRIVVSLLLNALGSYESEFLRFNNLTGHLYCFHPKWMEKSNRNMETKIFKIHCLEIAITDELRLSISVRTFTSELLKKDIDLKAKKFEEYPQYTLAANNTLRRKLSDDAGKSFIQRQTKGKKTTVPFMDIQNIEKFECSKMGIVVGVLTRFNEKYSGMCKLSFQEINNYTTAISNKGLVRENQKVVQNLLDSIDLRIIDYIGDEYSATFCKEIQHILKEKYKVNAPIGKRISKKGLNICVIHNALYYDGQNDPHSKDYGGASVQHITLEDFMGNAKVAISTVIHELLIKNDIQRHQFSLFDWTGLGLHEDVSFGLKETIDEEDRYFFMKIRPDGSFDFQEQKLDMFCLNEYTDCVNIFTDAIDVVGVVRFSNGDINIIRKTEWFTIPEIDNIRDELFSGNTYLRNAEKRLKLFSSITDVKMFDQGKKKYYFSGIIGDGMQTTVQTSAIIRSVEPYKNALLKFDDFLSLMNVTFVRNGQLTVLPFPFKYLREYIRKLK